MEQQKENTDQLSNYEKGFRAGYTEAITDVYKKINKDTIEGNWIIYMLHVLQREKGNKNLNIEGV